MASTANTIRHLIESGRDDAPAICAPDRPDLSYSGLRELADNVSARLGELGIGRGDRVAIVLPNGPEMAAAFVTVGCAATTAPLNPAYKAPEFDFYLSDLNARALLVMAGTDSDAVTVAKDKGIAVLALSVPDGAPAGAFEISGEAVGPAKSAGGNVEDDIALILHTSGTTSRPKIVPLSQRNVTASAANVAGSLNLTPADRCLNVMPLFHIHGLIAAVLASLSSGASVSCTPGFDALRFFRWLDDAKPSWYTAVPTMHQAILARAERNRDVIEAAGLRFLRSSSASLPAPVMRALEETFDAPVIEAYGMTEAAHQMTCNPLGAAAQKPGAVGLPAGPEVRIADEGEDRLIDSASVGEVVISGPNVTAGYEGNAEANEKNFFMADGKRWFRTGDQGTFDPNGYLGLTGRLKEIINRGGEKVSPLEVDAILLEHPDVAQAVTFAIPHEKLGEEIGAAVVAREGASLAENAVRDFAANRLAGFKVPRKLIVLDEIPKGATGKVQRIGLADKLGLTGG